MGLVSRAIEEAGVPTVSLANMRGPVERVKPPRTLLTRFPRGQSAGPSGHPDTQRAVVREALDLLVTAVAGGEVRDFGSGGTA